MKNWPISYQHADDRWVGRRVKNIFDQEETVALQCRRWKHFDWLAEQGYDMVQWVKNVDIERHRPEYKMTLEGELDVSLFFDERRRYLLGQPCPLFINPDGYEGKMGSLAALDRLPTDHDFFERNLVNLLGVEVPISMQGKHWRYYDWLVQKNGDMFKWVIDADFARQETGNTLSQELMGSLRRHERDNFLKGHNVPLYISPNGYMDIDVRKNRNEGIPRDLINIKGETEIIKMPKGYWQHFDWLDAKGVDMKQWVLDADVSRQGDYMSLTLRSELMLQLRDDERMRVKAGKECPLFINLNGYGTKKPD